MRSLIYLLTAIVALTLADAAVLDAQTRGRIESGRRERAEDRDRRDRDRAVIVDRDRDRDRRDRRDRDDDDDDDDDRFDRRDRRDRDDDRFGRGNGRRRGREVSAFCRTGEGHPVFGRSWCNDQGGRNVEWRRASWEDVIFRAPRRQRDGAFDRGTLGDILGDIVLGRLDTRSRTQRFGGPLTGEWRSTMYGGPILLVRAGGIPLAQFVDSNRDGRVDAVLLAELR